MRSRVCLFLHGKGGHHVIILSFIRLWGCVEEMFHGQPPHFLSSVKAGNHGFPSASAGQELTCRLRGSYGGGKSYPAWMAACKSAHSFYQAESLQSPVRSQQRMDFVNDDEPQIRKEGRDFHMLVDHQRFKGFRSDLKYSLRLTHEFSLLRLRHISVPARDRNTGLFTQFIQASELIVDQSLQRGNVHDRDTGWRIFVNQREDWEESRLGLA